MKIWVHSKFFNNTIIIYYVICFIIGAPGVEIDSVVCDNNTLHRIVDSSAILNEIIQEIVYAKNPDDN